MKIQTYHASKRGSLYKPSLRVRDVPSLGRSSRIKSWTNERVCHLLSMLELSFFYLLDWAEEVVDIREQYALPLEETLAIAKELGIRHPKNPRTKDFSVMTTDFVITIQKNIGVVDCAYSVKPVDKLQNRRTLEKLELERFYWSSHGIDWTIITEHQLPKVPIKNIEWLHPYRDSDVLYPLSEKQIFEISEFLIQLLIQHNVSLAEITTLCDRQLCLTTGTSLSVVRHLIASRKLKIDINQLIHPGEKLNLLSPLLSSPDSEE